MSYEVTLNALGTSYSIPEAGQTNYVNDLSLYLRDLATVVNDASSGTLVTPVFNVKTYGATGNGSTDDTTAILTAAAALAATGQTGGSLYFPSGIYKTTATIPIGTTISQRNVKITGDGVSSVIRPTGAFSATPVIEFRNVNYWQVSDVTIDATSRTGTGDNILVDGCSFGVMTNATVSNATRYGINITKINGSGFSTFNVVNLNVFASNAGGNTNVSVSASAVGNSANTLTGGFPPPYTVDVRQRFGVAADGTTDDTASIQAALDYAYTEINTNHNPVTLIFPPGDMKVTSTLVVKGNSATAPSLIGATTSGTSFNGITSRFLWYGVANGVMVYTQSFNRGLIRDIQFDGRSIAGILLHVAASTYADPSILAATSGFRVDRCTFGSVKIATVGNGCVALGTDTVYTGGNTFQCSEGVFSDCNFAAENNGAPGFTYAGMKGYGWKTLSAGNCKNFALYDCTFTTCNVSADWTNASGDLVVVNVAMGDVHASFYSNSGHLVVVGGDIEGANVDDYRLVVGTTGSHNASTAEIFGVEAVSYMAGASGKLLEYAGTLILRGNRFSNSNYSVSGDPTIVNPYTAVVSGINTTGGCLISEGNLFTGCLGTYAPYVDSNGNSLTPTPGQYGANTILRVSSQYDVGGSNVSPIRFGNFDSSEISHYNLSLNSLLPTANPATGTIGYLGQIRRGYAKITLAYTDFQAAALTKDITLLQLNAGTYLRKVRAKVTAAFTGSAGTVALKCGIDTGGDGKIWPNNDVKSAPVTIGDATADYTTGPGMGDNLSLGYIPGTSAYLVTTRMTSGSGNLSTVSAGSVTFYIEYELP